MMFLSIMGMYEYDDSVFDGLDIPTYTDSDNTVHIIDKTTVINNILLNCAEMELLYPNFDTMKLAIGVWSAANQETWSKLIETQFIKYNPIWNVDADETEKLQHGHTETRTPNLTDTRTPNLTDTRTPNLTDTQRPNITDTESVQGFNSTTWSESKKVVNSGSLTLEKHGTETDVRTGTDTMTHTGTDTMAHTGIDTTTKRRTGNIGVTTTQKMIQEQRDIAIFNIIDYIALSFKERFCLLVY